MKNKGRAGEVSHFEGKIWKSMYGYRSSIAHGRKPDFKTPQLSVLQNANSANELIKEAVRKSLRQAYTEPQLIADLRRLRIDEDDARRHWTDGGGSARSQRRAVRGIMAGGTSASDHYRKVLVLYLEVLVLYLERPATQHCAAACSQKGRF
jgi:hypothetical protein